MRAQGIWLRPRGGRRAQRLNGPACRGAETLFHPLFGAGQERGDSGGLEIVNRHVVDELRIVDEACAARWVRVQSLPCALDAPERASLRAPRLAAPCGAGLRARGLL